MSDVKNAIILAAGLGSRMAPLTHQTPKGLIPVKGTPMVERIIEQLHEVGIKEIIVVTGHLASNFDYLVSKYGVKLVFNPDYATANNLSSIACVQEHLSSSYIICPDSWSERNIFNKHEQASWYACKYFTEPTSEWICKPDANGRIMEVVIGGKSGFGMYGPAYFDADFSDKFKKHMRNYLAQPISKDFFWEDIVIRHLDEMPIYINDQSGNIYEFDSLEELAAFDDSYKR